VFRKSLPHNLLSDPHLLNLYATILYKNMVGEGVPVGLPVVNPKPFICNTYAPLVCVANKGLTAHLNPLDETLTENRGRVLQTKGLSQSGIDFESAAYLITTLLGYRFTLF